MTSRWWFCPGQVHGVAVADGEHVGGAVGEPHPGARGGGLHDELGVVGDRVLERLLARGDPAERRVVVGAVVQGGQPTVRRVHHPGDQRGAVGAEHGLRGLDLHLEPHRRVRQAELVLDRGGGVHERPHLLGARHLRQRHHEPVQRAARLGVRRQEPGQRAHASAPGRRLERLDADPRERWCCPVLLGLGERVRSGAYVLVLVGVVVSDVAVLEVDPQVLDRLVGQLGLDPPDDVGVARPPSRTCRRARRAAPPPAGPSPVPCRRRTRRPARTPCGPAGDPRARRGSAPPAARPPRRAVRPART